MRATKQQSSLDQIGLIIIGAGASVFYYYFEKKITDSQDLAVLVTMGIILLISFLTQLLINNVNRARQSLHEANENLEIKVRERTAELRESENKYRTIFENTGTAIVIVQDDMKISLANSEFVKMSGFSKQEIEGCKPLIDFVDPKNRRKLTANDTEGEPDALPNLKTKNLACKFVDKHQRRRDILMSLANIPGSDKSVASLADITELKEAERQIFYQAFHDPLTNLPNRSLFMEHLTMAIKRSKRRAGSLFAVLYLDIDRFKLVNDSLGHNVGDNLLKAFANRIKESLREIDTLARFGGDEFVILLEDIESEEYASSVAQRVQKALKRPFIIDGKEVFAPASVGVVLNTEVYHHPETVIRDADAAMYHAKENGRAQFKVFDKKLHEKALHLLQRETDLRKAIDRNEFENFYQPIVEVKSASIVGFESLIRWNHPQLGLLYPGSFITIAEETGLIIPMTKFVVLQACEDLKRWQDRLGDCLRLSMSVNISSKHFLRPNLMENIQEILQKTGVPPDQLKLEITETALMEEAEETIPLIERLRAFGIQLVIDDFGTGYSSLSYLQRLPIDTLKVDRSFVSRIQQQQDGNRNIVEAIMSLAHRLNMTVVAEGVETIEQLEILAQMNCQMAQGHYFSKALPRAKVDELVDKIASLGPSPATIPFRLPDMLSN
jgi:diguanylate cyclase (GGDEF)-like protein/PAS domain S-box-containing protein